MEDLRRRLISWWWDYAVVLTWLGVVFVMLGLPTLTGAVDLEKAWSRQGAADLVVTGLTVVPYFLYLLITENSAQHATWGKRRSNLAVVVMDGTPASRGRVAIRNAVKVLPWQFGHMAAMRFAGDATSGVGVLLSWMSLFLLLLVAGPVLVGRRGLHDKIAGTTVVVTEPAASLRP